VTYKCSGRTASTGDWEPSEDLPELEEFQVDLVLLGKWATWPYNVLKELAAFDKPIKLILIFYLGHLTMTPGIPRTCLCGLSVVFK
jgi:hypothetical protein